MFAVIAIVSGLWLIYAGFVSGLSPNKKLKPWAGGLSGVFGLLLFFAGITIFISPGFF